jgi:hypothetical protein
MRLSQKEGFWISVPYFYKLKKSIVESRFDRLNLIAKSQFVDQHLERIDQLELVNQEMSKKYRQGDYKALDALLKIAELQIYISPYHDASRYVMEKSIKDKNDKQKESESISIV